MQRVRDEELDIVSLFGILTAGKGRNTKETGSPGFAVKNKSNHNRPTPLIYLMFTSALVDTPEAGRSTCPFARRRSDLPGVRGWL